MFGTFKLKDEIKKNNLILVPSAQFDFGDTILIGYKDQIDYLLSKNIKKLLFNKKFVFSNENIEVYEVVF